MDCVDLTVADQRAQQRHGLADATVALSSSSSLDWLSRLLLLLVSTTQLLIMSILLYIVLLYSLVM